MTKEFVTYEQALALKELGFNQPCMAYYKDIKGEKYLLDDSMSHDGECNAPLKQQAFRWFREKHGLYSFIDRGGVKGIYHAFVGGSEHGWLYGNNGNSPSEFTYEEAEDACINKLISLVKQK